MCALFERFFFAWRSLAAAAGLSTRVSYTFFFFLATAESQQSNSIL
jgi:hypothetical protein